MGLWVDDARLASLPTSGAAWESLIDAAKQPADSPDLSNKDDNTNVFVLAKALAYRRIGEDR